MIEKKNNKQSMWRTNTEGEPIRRHMLKEIVPMDTPLSMDVEASPLCTLRCNYCPHSLDLDEKKKLNIGQGSVMSEDVFQKIVEQCKMFPKPLKNIRFAGYGEPLLNSELANWIKLIKKEGIADTVTIFSNGIPLSKEKAEELAEAGVDTLLFDIQGLSDEDYKVNGNRKIDFNNLYDKISYYYRIKKSGKVFIKTFKYIIQGREKEFFDLFDKCADEIVIENIYETCSEMDYEGMITNEKETCGVDFVNTSYCPWPWYQLAINATGVVTACPLPVSKTSDFLIVGNVNKESLIDIWNGEKLNNVRYRLLKERETITECKNCKYTEMLPKEDLIDTEVDRLIQYCEGKKNE